ncbi:hypothetical protein H0274_03685 [Altererythrobacter sp. CC-YST694]|uniref:hypothetical protein n=1 Tax=Altererythrobacter sp. CC-YST694 TaxID=2755038 RepID=UPI001D018E47|nr:hypothetical protein [Altererythrobacter sp. CC-YST694]MCB5424349.1 hypothetical protein [Altererythrobacter sp. CC-YST694]
MAGLLLCLLSACWLSEEPLLTAKNASEVDFAGTYRSVDDEGSSDELVIAQAPDRAYRVGDGEEQLTAHYLRLGKEWYLAQYEGKDEPADIEERRAQEAVYLFQAVREAGGRLYFYSPDCDRTDGDYPGMERSSGVCTFRNLEGIRAAVLAYIERIETGEIAEEPAIWARISVSR